VDDTILKNIKLVYWIDDISEEIEYMGIRVVTNKKVTQKIENEREFTAIELVKILKESGVCVDIEEVCIEKVEKDNW